MVGIVETIVFIALVIFGYLDLKNNRKIPTFLLDGFLFYAIIAGVLFLAVSSDKFVFVGQCIFGVIFVESLWQKFMKIGAADKQVMNALVFLIPVFNTINWMVVFVATMVLLLSLSITKYRIQKEKNKVVIPYLWLLAWVYGVYYLLFLFLEFFTYGKLF